MKKKVLPILLSAAMTAGMLAGCSTTPPAKTETTAPAAETTLAETQAETTAAETEAEKTTAVTAEVALPAEGKLKTAQGIVTKISSSKPATADKAGTAQVDSTIVSVTYDANGVITKCVIDNAQTKVSFNAAGEIQTDLTTVPKTKVELGDEYGMKKNSAVGKEWYEQADIFADWIVGKTLDEVKGLNVKKVDDSHPAVPDVPELTSTVSINVGDMTQAIEKAMTSKGMEFDAVDSYKTGMSVVTSIGKSKAPADGKDGTAQVDSAVVTVTLDDSGKILASVMDAAQTKVNFNDKGEITSDLTAPILTKVDLGVGYGMVKASTIGKEWFEQIQAFAQWTVGKTAGEVTGMQVKAVDEEHTTVPNEAELTSTVSISVGDYMTGIEKAAAAAK